MKLKENAHYTKLKEQLWKVFEEFDRGDLAHYGLIIDTIKIGRGEQGWATIVNSVRKRILNERGIATRPEPGVGLRFLTNTQQVVVCGQDRTKRIRTQARNGFNEIQRAESKNLSDHERKLQAFSLAGMQSIKSQSKSSVLDITVDK